MDTPFRKFHVSLVLLIALFLLMLTSRVALASTVTINDLANVLDVSKVNAEAEKLPNPILIYTTRSFSGSNDEFKLLVRNLITSDDAVTMGIDVQHRYFYVAGGKNVKVTGDQWNNAYDAFKNNIGGNDFTKATLAALSSVRSTLTESSGNNGGSSNWPGGIGVIVAGLLGGSVVLVWIVALIRKRRGGVARGGGSF
jgi:hypothetical protein